MLYRDTWIQFWDMPAERLPQKRQIGVLWVWGGGLARIAIEEIW